MTVDIDVVSFGCRLNAAEAEAMRTLAASRIERPTVIVNTCAVTAAAERDARRAIRRLRRERPGIDIVVTGCAAQRAPGMFAAMPEVTRVLGNREKLDPRHWSLTERIAVGDVMRADQPPLPALDAEATGTRAIVEAQHGCDHRCTFCIIPFTRGPARSQPLGVLVERANRLVARGVAELVLSGVDLASYGSDQPGGPSLGRAVRRLLAAVPQLVRLRLSSLDPAAIDDDLVDAYANEPRLMPHVHLSLQSADDLILKRMRRRHTSAQAGAAIARLRRARPEIAFGADLIAGFPTESDAAAARTRDAIVEHDLAYVHVFAFDPRPGTPASRMPPVPPPIAAERAARLRMAARESLARHLARHVGQPVDVLVERDGRTGHGVDFSRVQLAEPHAPGHVVRARAIAATADTLLARVA